MRTHWINRVSPLPATCALLLGAASPLLAAPSVEPLRTQAKEFIAPLPARMPGAELDTPAMIKLGEKLYFEKMLSANKTISCNSCHAVDQKKAGVDGEPTSGGAFGKKGDRNSPTVLNAGFHFVQFWDGRAPDLAAQAKGPILNPVEMAMPSEAEVVKRLKTSRDYPALFRKAFPDATEAVTYDNLAKAIAAFERTLVTRDRVDDFLKGDDRALNAREQSGLKLFLETGCTTCHNGPVLGANSFQKVGLVHPYSNTNDLGRFVVSKEEGDEFKFKVPSLRNVALTAPYFHDGNVARLEDAVRQMAHMQLDKQLTVDQVADLAAFLRALSDKSRTAAK
jgi:cytochrome c peroxidase